MTDDPNQPFQPPRRPGQPGQPGQPVPGQGPPPSSSGTSGSAFAGVMLGLGFGLLGPLVIGGFLLAILTSTSLPGAIQVLVPIIVASVGTIAIYLLVVNKLDTNSPNQAAMRTALVVTGWISLAVYAVGLLLVGLCFAVLLGAY